MAKIYRKVYISTWGDGDFNKLTPIPPCGQGLWLWLLTSPLTGSIPGLFCAGPRAMAEALKWSDEAFAKAFQEVLSKGMAEADQKARLIWLPNAIEYNRPESPNVITGWATYFDTLPECSLRDRAVNHLRTVIYTMGEGFIQAFDKAFGKPSPKPSVKAMPNQEQKQEHKQEQDNTQERTRDPSQLPATMDTELFSTIQAAFLSQGPFTDPGGEVIAIRKIMGYAQNNPSDIQIMLEAYFMLTRGDDKFWSRQPFLPSALAKSGIWDRVKIEARKQLEAPQDRAEEWEQVAREVAARKAAECAN